MATTEAHVTDYWLKNYVDKETMLCSLCGNSGVNQRRPPMRDLTKDPKYNSTNAIPFAFAVGDTVLKNQGDYSFEGVVLSVFRKRSGTPRYVVENEDGIVHVFNHSQLQLVR